MVNNIADALYSEIREKEPILNAHCCKRWAMTETESNIGIAMNVPDVESLLFSEINCYYNRGSEFYEPFEIHYTRGIDFFGKTLGVIGHMSGVINRYNDICKKLYVFDMEPKDKYDLPAEFEKDLLPECDIVVISGSSLVNGTLENVISYSKNAYKILTGPSVPKSKILFDFGIDRIAGMSVTDFDGMKNHINKDLPGSPYVYGIPFIIEKN